MKKLNIGIFKVLSLAVGLAVGLVLIAKISVFSRSSPSRWDSRSGWCS